jgi:ElaB/YqjD/DUF883 family membrane-anchored ribosome-binding protein
MSEVMERTSRVANDATEQARRLRGEVEALIRDTVAPALADALQRAAMAKDHVQRHSETVAENVRGRPLLSIALAGIVGFFFGRVTR